MGLCLSRDVGQSICIGPDVTVKVLEIRGKRVILDTDAPRTTQVDRSEVRERKQKEKPAA